MGVPLAGWRVGHRPALDGLRGVAVLLVVADHAGFLPELSGGIGVTVFFVLSGFLITRVIVEAREGGSWSMPRFMANRFVRLFPALALMVVVVSTILLARGLLGHGGDHGAGGLAADARLRTALRLCAGSCGSALATALASPRRRRGARRRDRGRAALLADLPLRPDARHPRGRPARRRRSGQQRRPRATAPALHRPDLLRALPLARATVPPVGHDVCRRCRAAVDRPRRCVGSRLHLGAGGATSPSVAQPRRRTSGATAPKRGETRRSWFPPGRRSLTRTATTRDQESRPDRTKGWSERRATGAQDRSLMRQP